MEEQIWKEQFIIITEKFFNVVWLPPTFLADLLRNSPSVDLDTKQMISHQMKKTKKNKIKYKLKIVIVGIDIPVISDYEIINYSNCSTPFQSHCQTFNNKIQMNVKFQDA